jgi:exodeoxyribonuclease-3
MPLKIATWNINSVRIRIPQLKKLAEVSKADIICLQETKTEDATFPLDAIKSVGFPYVYFTGQKSYNGMAILSKVKLNNVSYLTLANSLDKRHICATLPDGTVLHNFYVPAGGDIPDPKLNPAFDFKLRFVDDMTKWALKEKNKNQKMIIVGDFNIAPLPDDVWSHKQLLKIVSHTPEEVNRLDALKASLNWCDTARHFTDASQKLYSWWSYRNRDWRKSDRGRRLDHIWVTPSLKPALRASITLKDARDWESPSDHVPVVVDIALPIGKADT